MREELRYTDTDTHGKRIESLRYRLTAKLDVKGIITGISDGVIDINCAVAIVFDVNVNDFAEIKRA